MRAQFEVLIFRVTSVRYCLFSENGQVVENWRPASRTEIRTTDLAATEITVDQKDDNHEVQRPTDWPVQNLHLKTRNLIDFWVAVKEAYEELGVKVIKYLIPRTQNLWKEHSHLMDLLRINIKISLTQLQT
ncbi:hypothetical protein AVEN_242601-1 [Araneus ventricosus]|uniref:Uncharacterized protein n=1 Tax=Araneus ventricosus TaxID=182803 RepID=A0A4Y2ERQ4_ARAVE|nr:hypothetical protein AVEN_242601-1 [Araneus ventricosus]